MTESNRVQALALALVCPFCGKGPYRVLASHTSKAHDVDPFTLRELAGLTWQDPLCEPEVSDLHREVARKHPIKPGQSSRAAKSPMRITKAAKLRIGGHRTGNRPDSRAKAARTWEVRLGVAQHGTRRKYRGAKYRPGCRCDDCRAWNAEQAQKQRDRVKQARRTPKTGDNTDG